MKGYFTKYEQNCFVGSCVYIALYFCFISFKCKFYVYHKYISFLLNLTKFKKNREFKYTLQAQWHAKAGSKFPLLLRKEERKEDRPPSPKRKDLFSGRQVRENKEQQKIKR